MRPEQFGSTGCTPIFDAFLGHFQMTLKCPVAATDETFVQAMTAVHRTNGANRNFKRIVMPVEDRRLSWQPHQLLCMWRDPYLAPADIGTDIAGDFRSHGARKHLRAKTMPENWNVTSDGILQQRPLVLDPRQNFIDAVIAPQHDNPAEFTCIDGCLSIRHRRNESVRDAVFIQVIAQYARPLR